MACGVRLLSFMLALFLGPGCASGDVVDLCQLTGFGSDGGDWGTFTSPSCPDGVVPGSVLLRSQADVEALEGCQAVDGSLYIAGPAVESLEPLDALRCVADHLDIGDSQEDGEPHLTTLAGLEGLHHVGADLSLHGLSTLSDISALANVSSTGRHLMLARLGALETFEGLHGLQTIGASVMIHSVPRIQDLQGLRGLRQVGGDLYIDGTSAVDLQGLENLETIGPGSELVLAAHSRLASLQGLSAQALASANRIRLSGNPQLADVSALGVKATIEELSIHFCDGLEDLRGLENLEQVGRVVLSDNANLKGIESLSALRQAETIELRFLPKLSLIGLFALEQVGTLWLTDLPGVATLDGLDALTDLRILLVENTAVETLGPLPKLETLDSVRLEANRELVDLTRLVDVGELRQFELVNGGPGTDLSDLNGLEAVTESFRLTENFGLTAEQLPILPRVGAVTVVLNRTLDQGQAEAWAAAIPVHGRLKIDGNAGVDIPLDPCPWVNDHECDEMGGLCAAGTDGKDCFVSDGHESRRQRREEW